MDRRLTMLVLTALGCGQAPALASPSCPDGDWRPATAPDFSVALCLAPGFAPAGEGRRWARGEVPDADYAWLSIAVLDSAEAVREWGRPPVPRSFRVPDPPGALHTLRAESVVVHDERI